MKICYVDEAGCTGPLTGPKIQPVFVVLGVVLDARAVHAFTQGFIELKRRFFPGAKTELRLDAILQEAKGSKLRHYAVCRDTPRDRKRARWAVGLLDGAVRLLEQHDARIFGRVWVKPVNGRFNGRAVYTCSIQYVCATFQRFLDETDAEGLVIADARRHTDNKQVSHSIFTQRFSRAGDPYPSLIEAPTFGLSENHAGIQAADLVCSALVFPMAVDAYCRKMDNIHVRDYSVIRARYGERLKRLQYRYHDSSGRRRGGLTVSDPAGRSGAVLFAAP